MQPNTAATHMVVLLSILFLAPICPAAVPQSELSDGQVIYVPAYSHIYGGNRENPFLLTVTLSIRNVDPVHMIQIRVVDYYQTEGRLVKSYIASPVTLKPLETLRYVVPEQDKSGGSGANFIVEWRSKERVNPPIVETIMIGTQNQLGVSFTSRGQAIHPHAK